MGFVINLLFWHPDTYLSGGQNSLYLLGTDASLVTVPETLLSPKASRTAPYRDGHSL